MSACASRRCPPRPACASRAIAWSKLASTDLDIVRRGGAGASPAPLCCAARSASLVVALKEPGQGEAEIGDGSGKAGGRQRPRAAFVAAHHRRADPHGGAKLLLRDTD